VDDEADEPRRFLGPRGDSPAAAPIGVATGRGIANNRVMFKQCSGAALDSPIASAGLADWHEVLSVLMAAKSGARVQHGRRRRVMRDVATISLCD